MKDIELLQYVHETAEMGILGLQDIVGQVQTAKLKKSLQGQIAEYQTIASEAAKLLQAKGTAPKDPSLMARLSSEVMSTMQTLADSSDSKIAEMTIKGNNMGITKGLKHLHLCHSSCRHGRGSVGRDHRENLSGNRRPLRM